MDRSENKETSEAQEEEILDACALLIDKVIGRLRTIYDPEIPVNIYDLGLVYKIDPVLCADGKHYDLTIDMTLTAPGCPVADAIVAMAQNSVADLSELHDAVVNLVWDPPWDQSRMSDEAKLQVNMI